MATQAPTASTDTPDIPDAIVVRFAGDSGDGMQLTGGQFTLSTALAGNDLATFRRKFARRKARCSASAPSRSTSDRATSTLQAMRRTCWSR